MTPTPSQIHLLQHTIGVHARNPIPYRNHFVAAPGHHDMPDLEALTAAGLMRHAKKPAFLAEDDVVFQATPEGQAAAIAALPPPPKRTRYGDFLDADGGDTFAEFLLGCAAPRFEQRGDYYSRQPREWRMYREAWCKWTRSTSRDVQGEWAPTKKAAKASYKEALRKKRESPKP